jgi:glycosyl hydrolase family 108/predicted peptidoglycan binding protein
MDPLIGVAIGVLPDIIKLIAGDKTGQLATQVGKAVSDTLGTTNPVEAQTKLTADPAAQSALQQKLGALALEATKTQYGEADLQRQDALANTQGARNALQALTTTNNTIAWTAPTISYLVIVGFFVFLFVLIWLYKTGAAPGATPDDKNSFIPQIINIVVGALTAAFATVVNFWLGSSAGSQKKDDANLTLQTAQSDRASATMNALQNKVGPTVSAPVQPTIQQAPTLAKDADQQSSARFDACMSYVFKAEGGYSDTPGDSGGPTNFGITLATLESYEGKKLNADDVKSVTPEVAKEIYRTNYWNRMQCGSLPDGLDLEVFDFGVNSGPSQSVKTLQGVVGVTQDGSIGPITLAAVGALNPRDVIARFTQARLAFYQGLNQPEFLKGWEARVASIQTAALSMLASAQTAVA